MTMVAPLAALLVVVALRPLQPARAHGRLIEPPSRASAWRYGFDTRPDYNDHELHCGGFHRQWYRNAGKCGVCGDAWDLPAPRPHEAGGPWGSGALVRRYARGAPATLRVELTASHGGHFEFRVCAAPAAGEVTQRCLDQHVLRRAAPRRPGGASAGSWFYPHDGSRIYEMRYRLPNISCSHCVLQWIYIAGNNWGLCPNGTHAVGCGPQEEFRACADISIGADSNDTPAAPSEPPPADTEHPADHAQPEVRQRNVGLTVCVVLGGLVLVVVMLASVYIRYYRSSIVLKNCLKAGRKEKGCSRARGVPPPPECEAPAPPPRTRRPQVNESLA